MVGTLAGAGVLVVRHNRVLMVLRDRGGKTRWEFPSGLLEDEETFEEAAIREVFEETNQRVTLDGLLCTVLMQAPSVDYQGVNLYFLAEAVGNRKPYYRETGEPIHEAAFVDLTAISPRALHPVDRRILRAWRRSPLRRPFYVRVRL